MIELKVGKNRPSHEQRWWLDSLRLAGWRSELCYGHEAAIQTIEDYLNVSAETVDPNA